ncbi:MAG: hypothetical protein JWR32_62 [Mycobacterium sp.]|jgi:hypothetical protein|nr:hypothetical protein [Mycobacterium sp.]
MSRASTSAVCRTETATQQQNSPGMPENFRHTAVLRSHFPRPRTGTRDRRARYRRGGAVGPAGRRLAAYAFGPTHPNDTGRLRQLRRHGDRVLRLLHLWQRRSAGVPHRVFPEPQPHPRNDRLVGDVRGRLHLPAGRRRRLRSLRRPPRAEKDLGRHAAEYGPVHRRRGPGSQRRSHRCRRAADPAGAATITRICGGWRMGRVRPAER